MDKLLVAFLAHNEIISIFAIGKSNADLDPLVAELTVVPAL